MFFTPTERLSLDHMRKTGVREVEAASEKISPIPVFNLADQPELQLTVNGFVRRANGKSTTWLNQTALEENQSAQNIRVRQSASRPSVISIYLGDGQKTELKVGQSLDRSNGKIHDVLDPALDTTKEKIDKSKGQ
ncbi:MAG: hypothetical protein HY253_02905 [Burkholderiales bacterium]|nr:hypothetical protein [Burkholderiales bacterium]